MKHTNEVAIPPRKPGSGLAPAALLALGLTGCAVGPTFAPSRLPKPPKTDQYGAAPLPAATVGTAKPLGELQTFQPGAPVAENWWHGFGSQELDNRVTQALQHSPSVASAKAALTRAQENLRAANGGRLPAVALQAGAVRENTGPTGAVVSPYNILNASVTVAYTLDLFGAVGRGIEIQQTLADQQRWILQGVKLALAANVATASIQEAGLQAQLVAQEGVLKLLEEQADITQQQVRLGAKGSADLLAAQANLAQAQAGLPALHQQLEALRNQLYVYLGRFPSEGGLGSLALDGLTLPGTLPVSLPSELVRQRPDVLAAETTIHTATARLGLATANLFPSLTLTGSYGTSAMRGGGMPSADMTVWNAGLNLLQPIFNGGSLRAQKRAAAAGLDQAVADYRATLLNAFSNVADALNALQHDAEAVQAYGLSESAAKASLELAQSRYRLGAASYLQLLDATHLWLNAQMGLIQAQSARLRDTTALYAALGGGWTSKTN